MKSKEDNLVADNRSADLIVGISDGLLIPFAVCAAISRIAEETTTVILIGFITALLGAIAMGLARFYAGRSEMVHLHEPEPEELQLDDEAHKTIAEGIRHDNEKWNEYLRDHGLVIDHDIRSASVSARYISVFYFLGGIIPLLPYLFMSGNYNAFIVSCIIAIVCLFVFGYLKGRYTDMDPFGAALRACVTGGVLAMLSYMIAGFFA